MKKLFCFCLFVLFAVIGTYAQGYTRVNGYTRSNGTYVQPHYRTLPNNTVYDNWSTKGNSNPFTGEASTKYPSSSYSTYTTPTYSYPSTPTYPSTSTNRSSTYYPSTTSRSASSSRWY